MLAQSISSNSVLPPFVQRAVASASPVAAPADPEATFEKVLGTATNSGDQLHPATVGSKQGPVNGAPPNMQTKQSKNNIPAKTTAPAANETVPSPLIAAMLMFVPQIVNQSPQPEETAIPILATKTRGAESGVSGLTLASEASEPSSGAKEPVTPPTELSNGTAPEAQPVQGGGDEPAAVVQPLFLLGDGKTATPEIADAVSEIATKTSQAANSLSDENNSAINKNLQDSVISPKKLFVDIPSGAANPQVQEQVQVNLDATDSPTPTVVHSDAEKHGQAQSSFADMAMPTMRSAVISVSPSTVQQTAGPSHLVHGIAKPTPVTDSSSSSSSGSSSGQTNNQDAFTNDGAAGDRSASALADAVSSNANNRGSSRPVGQEPVVAAKSIPTQEVANAPGITATLPTPPVERNGAAALPAESQLQPPATANVLPPQLQDSESVSKGLISNAQLADASGHGEIRIAMDTEKLGMVELRAHMAGDTVGAAITVEKRDVHNALSLELPTLQQALNDKQFRVEQITLTHNSLGSTMSDGNASAKQDNHTSPGPQQRSWVGDGHEFSPEFLSTENNGIFDSLGRLSVRA